MTLADDLADLLLRLPPGAALLLPTDTIEALVHSAIDLAKASEPDRRFNVSAYVSRSSANEPEVLYSESNASKTEPAMPNGSIDLGEIAARAIHIEVACSRCGRRGPVSLIEVSRAPRQ